MNGLAGVSNRLEPDCRRTRVWVPRVQFYGGSDELRSVTTEDELITPHSIVARRLERVEERLDADAGFSGQNRSQRSPELQVL